MLAPVAPLPLRRPRGVDACPIRSPAHGAGPARYLFLALTAAQQVFSPADPSLAEKAKADLATLRDHLRTACLEPFDDLSEKKRQAMTRRVERMGKAIIMSWNDRPRSW